MALLIQTTISLFPGIQQPHGEMAAQQVPHIHYIIDPRDKLYWGKLYGSKYWIGRSYILNNLSWNTTYCWYVTTSNGSGSVTSPRWEFTTAETPTHLGTNITAPNCSSGISGNASISGTDNPISIVSTYRLNSGVQGIAQLAVAFIPSSVQNADNVSEQTALSASSQYLWDSKHKSLKSICQPILYS
jgi:hypothetical protein